MATLLSFPAPCFDLPDLQLDPHALPALVPAALTKVLNACLPRPNGALAPSTWNVHLEQVYQSVGPAVWTTLKADDLADRRCHVVVREEVRRPRPSADQQYMYHARPGNFVLLERCKEVTQRINKRHERMLDVVLVAPALQLDPFALPVLLDEHFVDAVLVPSIPHLVKGVEPVWVILTADARLDFDFLAQLKRIIKRSGGASPAVAQVYNVVVNRMNHAVPAHPRNWCATHKRGLGEMLVQHLTPTHVRHIPSSLQGGELI
ncbi:hypothetical protein JCM8547_001812 [Rhodosporidiobolus lusitaniae]